MQTECPIPLSSAAPGASYNPRPPAAAATGAVLSVESPKARAAARAAVPGAWPRARVHSKWRWILKRVPWNNCVLSPVVSRPAPRCRRAGPRAECSCKV